MQENSVQLSVLVIGGGATGMMAAGQAALRGKKVTIIEKNKALGEKLLITGGGRCNITNAEYNIHAFAKQYGKAEGFLYSPFSKFGVKETFSFFESLGLPLVVQARNRAFPNTEKAADVLKVLKQYLLKHGVRFKTGCEVKGMRREGNKIVGVETDEGILKADSFILATGGVSHPETGSTGDGFAWLKALGHTVKEPTPTIVPLAVKDEWIKMLAGVSLSFMRITFYLNGKKQFSEVGKILFTHFGLSGPLILNSASRVGELLEKGQVTATIDAFPDTELGTIENRIVEMFFLNKNKTLRTAFKEIVPEGTSKGIATLLPDIDFAKQVNSVTKEERKKIVHLVKVLPVTIIGLMGYDRAVVADGGVLLEELDMRTMRSKKFENLYVVGDLLNINRPSGGYSLQLCWTTGYIAGNSA